MKISKSKQELARIISENDGWIAGDFAAQQDDAEVWFSVTKPVWKTRCGTFDMSYEGHFTIGRLIPNRHQTILSRAEYFHLYPAPDADGWIEWKGGECPVGKDSRIDVKFSDRDELFGVDSDWDWGEDVDGCNIIAYRLHKSESVKSTAVGDGETNLATNEELEAMKYRPSIEQLMQIHCDRAHALSEKKAELIVAERQESEALDALKAACKEAGFDISPVGRIQEKQEPELVITDWRDLQVGDEVELISFQGGSARVGEIGKISKFFGNGDFQVDFPSQSGYSVDHSHIKFIRRP